MNSAFIRSHSDENGERSFSIHFIVDAIGHDEDAPALFHRLRRRLCSADTSTAAT